jgi:hypothetical protein
MLSRLASSTARRAAASTALTIRHFHAASVLQAIEVNYIYLLNGSHFILIFRLEKLDISKAKKYVLKIKQK